MLEKIQKTYEAVKGSAKEAIEKFRKKFEGTRDSLAKEVSQANSPEELIALGKKLMEQGETLKAEEDGVKNDSEDQESAAMDQKELDEEAFFQDAEQKTAEREEAEATAKKLEEDSLRDKEASAQKAEDILRSLQGGESARKKFEIDVINPTKITVGEDGRKGIHPSEYARLSKIMSEEELTALMEDFDERFNGDKKTGGESAVEGNKSAKELKEQYKDLNNMAGVQLGTPEYAQKVEELLKLAEEKGNYTQLEGQASEDAHNKMAEDLRNRLAANKEIMEQEKKEAYEKLPDEIRDRVEAVERYIDGEEGKIIQAEELIKSQEGSINSMPKGNERRNAVLKLREEVLIKMFGTYQNGSSYGENPDLYKNPTAEAKLGISEIAADPVSREKIYTKEVLDMKQRLDSTNEKGQNVLRMINKMRDEAGEVSADQREKSPKEKLDDYITKFKKIGGEHGVYSLAFNTMRSDKSIDFDNNDEMVIRFIKGMGNVDAVGVLNNLGVQKGFSKKTVMKIIEAMPASDASDFSRGGYNELRILATRSGLNMDKDVRNAIIGKNPHMESILQ